MRNNLCLNQLPNWTLCSSPYWLLHFIMKCNSQYGLERRVQSVNWYKKDVTCHQSHVMCHKRQELQPWTLPLLTPPLCTEGCCCWSLPRFVNNAWGGPKKNFFGAGMFNSFLAKNAKSETNVLSWLIPHFQYLKNVQFVGIRTRQRSPWSCFFLSWKYSTLYIFFNGEPKMLSMADQWTSRGLQILKQRPKKSKT